MTDSRELHYHFSELIGPYDKRLITIEAKMAHMDNDIKSLREDIKDIKSLIQDHVQTEGPILAQIKKSIHENALAVTSLKSWLIGVGATISFLITLVLLLNNLKNLGVFNATP